MTDKELIQKLKGVKSLEAAGNPNQDWVLGNKKILMSQVSPFTTAGAREEKTSDISYYLRYFNDLFRQRVFRPAMATLSVVALILVYTATVSVAGASLPGDMLYPIKTTQEKVQLALTFNDQERVKLQMSFVSKRAGELQKIVRETGDARTQKNQIDKTVKTISSEVKSVKDSLSKISIASVGGATLDLAKDIDTKTLEVKGVIVAARNEVNQEIKNEVLAGIKEAIDDTDDTGTAAIGVIVGEYEKGENITGDEVTQRVSERIKNTEGEIENAIKAINNVSTSTPKLIIINQVNTSTTIEVLAGIKNRPQEAQDIIEEAKDLLGNNDFTSALRKITETNDIVDGIESGVKSIGGSTTSTGQVLGDVDNIIDTSTDSSSQSKNDSKSLNETTSEVVADEVPKS